MGWIIAYFLGILTALSPKNPENTKRGDNNSYKKNDQRPPRIICAELATPIPISVNNAPKERHPNWKRIKTFFEIIGIASAIVLAIFTVLQWRDAHIDFVSTQRAWIGVRDPSSITNIVNNSGRPESSITYVVTLKNYGNSAASRLWATSKVATALDEIVPYIADSCKDATNGSNAIFQTWNAAKGTMTGGLQSGEVMFPTQEYGRWFKDVTIKRTGVIFIVGCVVYKDQFGNLRHTKFCEWVQTDLMKLKTSDLPVFLYSFFGANDAD